jgi:hypothetical protein
MSSSSRSATIGAMAAGVGERVARTARSGARMVSAIELPRMHRSGCSCGCDIPPPCWVPLTLDEVRTPVCAGSKAVVRLNITNCGFTKRTVTVTTTLTAADVQPKSVALEALERATVVLSIDVPAASPEGEERRAVIWVDGCRDHVIPWTVTTSCRNQDCCREVSIEDCPDLVHHWYDHFYCERGCRPHGG